MRLHLFCFRYTSAAHIKASMKIVKYIGRTWLFTAALQGASVEALQAIHVVSYYVHDLTFFFFLCFCFFFCAAAATAKACMWLASGMGSILCLKFHRVLM